MSTTKLSIAKSADPKVTIAGVVLCVFAVFRALALVAFDVPWLLTAPWTSESQITETILYLIFDSLVMLAIVATLIATVFKMRIFALLAAASSVLFELISNIVIAAVDGYPFIWPSAELGSTLQNIATQNLDLSIGSLGMIAYELSFYVVLLVAILALILTLVSKKASQNTASQNTASQTISSVSTELQKESNIMAAQWEIVLPGESDTKVDTATLEMYARAGKIKSTTLIKEVATGTTFTASQIPGVFSSKDYTTALLLSIFLGTLGVDRFYTGHIGLGIGKLLTAGGCGIWSIIDIILFATRKVTDIDGKPLA